MQIITREQWGARYRDGVGTRSLGSLETYLHHSVTAQLAEEASIEMEMAQMRVIEAIGQQRFGQGISYNLIGFPSGRFYEGSSIHRISYHSGVGRNTRGAGICLAGNYQKFPIGKRLINSTIDLLRYGKARGWWPVAGITEAHRDFKSTSCPGRSAYNAIDEINAGARAGGGDVVVAPDSGVRAQQRILAAGGYYRGAIDGVPGPMFLRAVKDYQAGQEFPELFPDGYWGPKTDAHAHWTRELQIYLNDWRDRWARELAPLREDYDYGRLTKKQVWEWQLRNHGRAYPSWAALDGEAGNVTCDGMGIRRHP